MTKIYGKTVALQDLGFTIKQGINGLIGPNGAGKTSLIKLLLGLIEPSQGTLKVIGKSPRNDSKIFEHIGWCPESGDPVPWLTPRQYLTKILGFYKWEKGINQRVKEMTEIFDINRYIDKKHRHLSAGMKQRVKIARAFIHQPQFVILDEPFQGLDISRKHKFRNFIKNYANKGNTILYASHLLFEVERISDYIIFLYDGHFIAQGEISAIRKKLFQFPLHIKIRLRNHINDFLREIISKSWIECVSVLERKKKNAVIEVHTSNPDQCLSKLPSIILSVNSELLYFKIVDIDLKALFKYLKKTAISI